MTTEVLAQNLVAGQIATFGGGRVLYVKSAAGNMTITAERIGSGASVRKFVNVTAGFKVVSAPGNEWTYLRVVSPTSQAVELVIGDDDVTVSNAVSISGQVSTAALPSTVITASVADTVIANASALSIPANVGRRRITVGSLGANTGSVRIQSVGAGASRGLELQPGTFIGLETGAAFDVRNDSGAAQTVSIFEES